MATTDRVQLIVRLPPGLVKSIKFHGIKADRSIQAIVEEAIRDYLKTRG